MRRNALNPDTIGGLLAIGIALLFWVSSGGLPAFEVKLAGPSFFPRVCAGLLALLGAALMGLSLRAPSKAEHAPKASVRNRRSAVTVPQVVLLSVVYYYTIHLLGFMLSTFLYAATLTLMAQERPNIKSAALSSCLIMVVVYMVFSYLLHASLPAGVLFR
ncbi:MAG: tripartite tricarboxylate transporter TctB family protein [Bacillota bacterium]